MARNSSSIPAAAVCLVSLPALAGVGGLARVPAAALPQPVGGAGAGLLGVTGAELLAAAPRLEVQLVLAAIQAIFWFLAVRLGTPIVEKWANSWPETTRSRWTKMNQATMKKSYMIDLDEPEAFRFACQFLMILTQHAVGGALCLPSVLGVLPALASALACHGALCEVGWEVQDYLSRWYDIIFGGPEGRARQPVPVMVLLTLHHAMGTLLVVPMNTYFHDSSEYHELVFLLQAAAVFASCLQQYGYTLDITRTKDLIMMKASVSLTAAVMLWSRLFRYWYVVYCLLSMLRAEAPGSKTFYGAFVVSLMMGLLNVLFIGDALGKFTKFMTKSTPALKDTSELDATALEEWQEWRRADGRPARGPSGRGGPVLLRSLCADAAGERKPSKLQASAPGGAADAARACARRERKPPSKLQASASGAQAARACAPTPPGSAPGGAADA